MFKFSYCAVVIVFTVMRFAQAGVVVLSEEVDTQKQKKIAVIKYQFEADKVRFDSAAYDEGGTETMNMSWIVRADKGVVWMMNPKDKTYTEMTRKQIEEMGKAAEGTKGGMAGGPFGGRGGMEKAMQDAMKKMPPEQRKKMEAQMGMNPMFGGMKLEVKPVGRGKFKSWSCDKFEEFMNGKKSREVCTASFQDVGVNASKETMGLMEEMARSLVKPMAAMTGINFDDPNFKKMSHGIQVRSLSFDNNGKQTKVMEVKSVDQTSIAASMFDVPAGYTKKIAPAGKAGVAPLDWSARPGQPARKK